MFVKSISMWLKFDSISEKKQKKETIMYNLTFLKPKNTKPEKPASTRL